MTVNIFYIEDMTSFRYAIPFIKIAKRLLDRHVCLVYNDEINSHKYNSISRFKNIFQQICEKNEIESINQKNLIDEKIKSLFCVENTARGISCESYYSFQHGFDYTGLYKNVSNATYLVTEKYFQSTLENLKVKSLVQPIPVVFWDWDHHIKTLTTNADLDVSTDKIAMMFYPESDSQQLFSKVKDRLESLGYKTCIKQRRKNQSIPKEFKNAFYDDVWYPSESIALPILSDFSIGFGTSAYTDLVHIKRDFIDLCVPDYAKKYYKPKRDNFISINEDFFENFCKLELKQVTVEEKLRNPCDYEEIKKFLEQILS